MAAPPNPTTTGAFPRTPRPSKVRARKEPIVSDAEKTEKEKTAEADAKVEKTEGLAATGPDQTDDETETEGDDGEDEVSTAEGSDDEAEAAVAKADAAPASTKKKLVEEDHDLSDDPALAREELALRERQSKLKKKGQGKAALAKAASKKLAEVREKRKVASAVDAADPLLARTNLVSGWLQSNQKAVQIGGAVLAAGLLATGGYLFYQQKHESDASVDLSKAVADDRGLIGEAPPEDDENRIKDPRPIFKTAADRRESALAKYNGVQTRFPGTGAAFLARLGEAAVLLDKRDADGAITAYTDAKTSPLAAADLEVRGRATEGLGFAYELKAQLDPAQKDKHLDLAMAEYKELENKLDIQGFKELGMYHQSRVFQAKGDKTKAKELLVALRERIAKPGESHPFAYIEEMASDRLRMIDPKAVPPKPKYNDAQLQQMLQKLRGGGAGGGGGAPPGLGEDDGE